MYTVLQINLHNCKFFRTNGALAFQTFDQSKCTKKIKNAQYSQTTLHCDWSKVGKAGALQCSRKTYCFADLQQCTCPKGQLISE